MKLAPEMKVAEVELAAGERGDVLFNQLPKAALVKSQGSERCRKRQGRRPCQVRIREASASKLLMRCRKE